MTALTLTRAEASAISGELLLWSADSFWIAEHIRDLDLDATNPEGVLLAIEDLQDAIERLRLEATIRNSGGWWSENSPGDLDLMARYHAGACPDTFTLDSGGAAALRTFCTERLPQAIASVDEDLANGLLLDRPENLRRRVALVSLAARLDIEISAGAVARDDGPPTPVADVESAGTPREPCDE